VQCSADRGRDHDMTQSNHRSKTQEPKVVYRPIGPADCSVKASTPTGTGTVVVERVVGTEASDQPINVEVGP